MRAANTSAARTASGERSLAARNSTRTRELRLHLRLFSCNVRARFVRSLRHTCHGLPHRLFNGRS